MYISCYTRKYLPMKSDLHGENSPEKNCCQYLANFLTILVKVISDLGFHHYYFSHYQNNPSWEYYVTSLFKPFTVPGNYSHTQDIIGLDTSPEQHLLYYFPTIPTPLLDLLIANVFMGWAGVVTSVSKKTNVSVKCRSHKF